MDAGEYLEKITSETYKRESDQDENVARSLPFFATSLALLATVLGLVKSSLPPFELRPYPILLFSCLGLVAAAVALVLCALLMAVRPRRFDYIMKESDLLVYASQLRDFYKQTGAAPADIENAVVADLREELTKQYATGAMRNRATNVARLQARGFALSCLVFGLIFAFTLIGAIIGHDLIYGEVHNGRNTAAEDRTSSPKWNDDGSSRPSASQADAAAYAGGDQGRRSVAGKTTAKKRN